ncbi:MAG TPA: MBL fold metallo-hydrolase [Candidatus Methylacidiphilales bacterium]|nr:MBL fold metallo-hydrolase [Candidatus Methylacidiphilales bacterium]
MQLTNLTRANEIGANSYLLDFGADGRIVLDAGMHPRQEGREGLPNLDCVPVDSVDAIFVSHAHHDHIGALPILMREQPRARVFMSEATSFLSEPLLHNSVEIMKKQRLERGVPDYPLFTHKELDTQARVWQCCGTNRTWSLKGYPDPDADEPLKFTFHDAGHILGSVGVELEHRGRRIFYTGDVNFQAQTLMKAADFPTERIDTLMIETTRGAHQPPEPYKRHDEVNRLLEGIQNTFDRGGAVLIPVFALGKTQELLALLHFLQKARRLPPNPIYIGGLSRTFSSVYDKLAGRTHRSHSNLSLLGDVAPQIMDGKIARQIKVKKGHIYLISSGMMTERTLSNIFAQNFLPHPNHSIFFVGYCDPESPAGRLRAAGQGGKVILNGEVGEQPVRCEVDYFDMTAHAQREDLLNYIKAVNPRVCVLVHGDPPALEWFQNELAGTSIKVVLPPPGEAISV